ncbi:MAG: glycerate kinase [Verrucomicrobia bacterium]|nr:glycerate kinase [Verrucomicrobiota bacterium]
MTNDPSPTKSSSIRRRLRVLIIPDKFKGTLTARQAAAAITRGWKQIRRGDQLETVAMSDGGDGFGETLSELLGAKKQTLVTVDAAHRPVRANWWWESSSRTAIIESARVVGLAQLPSGKFHPFELDTFGLGAVLRAAARKHARCCFVGIGGSATNDGGFGLARSLGWKFFGPNHRPLEHWTELDELQKIERPVAPFAAGEIIVAVDVQNPLLGRLGATRIYGPQKGIRPQDVVKAEACLGRLAAVCKKHFRDYTAKEPGTGAAGGLGFGLRCFLDAQLRPGFELFSGHAELEQRLNNIDLVITGEGAIDKSSLMGKGVGQIAALCRARRIPCLGLAGVVKDARLARRHFEMMLGLTPELTTEAEAKKNPAHWLARAAAALARKWSA